MTWSTNILGLQVQHKTYETVVDQVVGRASRRQGGLVAFCNVHMIMTAYRNADFRDRINKFDIVVPCGQPVRWATNWLGGAGLEDRVYGPETMLRLCEAAVRHELKVFLYGSYEDRVRRLADVLCNRFPGLRITGFQPSRFRPSTAEENRHDIAMIDESGAHIVFIGMGCPLQENWAYEHRNSIRAVQACVGGAFDFHSGAVRQAPPWFQKNGLEWLFRLAMEPGRLWRRYLTNNLNYVVLVVLQRLGVKQFPCE
jgi:exopolysaccharide biosynthesis WecB/TagA/CpsF family protein